MIYIVLIVVNMLSYETQCYMKLVLVVIDRLRV
jgi:hypothetical protein